ncbi:MAG: hypothetical protein ACYCYR_09220 [Desulfobulbaceae bacterium]
MSNHILLIFEGEKTEINIFHSLKKYYFKDAKNTILISAYCHDIYNLYHAIDKDPYLDLFELIKNTPQNKGALNGISRDKVSEIYLFFDYDGQASAATDDKIREMLSWFDEETDNGKLYLSYPMVESLKHLHKDVNFQNVVVSAKNNIKYKKLVHDSCEHCYRDYAMLTQLNWSKILGEHCKKMNHLMTGNFLLPTNLTTQIDAFGQQMDKYITPHKEVCVLCGFPIFIADYYGYSKLPELVSRK